MTKSEFALAFNEVLEDKQLPREIILGAIESAMVSAYRRAVNASSAQHVEAKIDPETGQVLIYAEKEVVEDIVDDRTEVTLEEARRFEPEVNLGDMAIVETTPTDFGRVAAQTARQVIQQRIREAERAAQMDYFDKQSGEIVSGVVQATNAQSTTVGLDMKAEGMLPGNQRIPGERYKVHDRIRAVVLEVKDGSRGPQIILSRSHRNFLRRLLENEVPEIYHGIVEVRAIAREPGQRAKVAVMATQPGVDPVGACVGIKGVRIQAIVKELHDEKIDIIQWDPDPVVYISKAISPARVTGVFLSEAPDSGRTATVVVQEDQLSLAIGRDGQNARLAAKLTGWRIDIKSLVEAAGDAVQKVQTDTELAQMLPAVVESIPTIEQILTKKSEGRPVTPEEYTQLSQFVDRVERRTIQIQEEAARVEEERVTAARAEIPPAAFQMSIYDAGIKEHILNILTEAEFETVGDLMLALKIDPDKVLVLPGIGPKAMDNIQESLVALTFPEPEPEPEPEAQLEAEIVAEEAPVIEQIAVEPEEVVEAPVAEDATATPVQAEVQPEAVAEGLAEAPAEEKAKEKKPKKKEEEALTEDADLVKDDVSLDELFALKEMFQTGQVVEEDEEDESGDKKKGKKKKKKHVEIEYDEELGEVVARKKHKRGEDGFEENW
jgi:transcription termination/antitermination protein NusA